MIKVYNKGYFLLFYFGIFYKTVSLPYFYFGERSGLCNRSDSTGALRAESGFDAFGDSQLSTASTALPCMMKFEPCGFDCAGVFCPNAGKRAIEQSHGDAIGVVCTLSGGANGAVLGIEQTNVLIVTGVVRPGEDADEIDAAVGVVAIFLLPDLEGVVGLGAVICGPFGGNFDGERGVTGGDEGGRDH
jgi:hypothetical protein